MSRIMPDEALQVFIAECLVEQEQWLNEAAETRVSKDDVEVSAKLANAQRYMAFITSLIHFLPVGDTQSLRLTQTAVLEEITDRAKTADTLYNMVAMVRGALVAQKEIEDVDSNG